ncbi:MAG: hypothetical protein HOF01_02675 [Chloroflexi bacterium]|nr:hypothetical protein [Chloroflexota bacterium]
MSKIQLWVLLNAIVLVSLVVLPESNFVDITSTPKTTFLRMLGAIQAGVLLSRLLISFTGYAENPFTRSIQAIKANKPALAILASIAAVTTVSIISASLSILPHQSWWGRVPAGFEAGEFTALMYVIMSISAFVSIYEINSSRIVWNALALTGVLAALVGLFQFFGWSPLGISSTHNSKLTGTNGNPIFFGAMLVILAPITLGVLITGYKRASKDNHRWWIAALATASYVFSLSLFATGSRGPILGLFVAGIATLVMLASTRQIRSNFVPLVLVLAFIGLGALTVNIDPTVQARSITTTDGSDETSSLPSSPLSDVSRTNTLDLRIRYWKLSGEMAIDREPVPYTNGAPKAVRWLFGYGTDMFRFAGTHFADDTTFTRRLTAAHNDPINRLVEQGFLGLATWISLWLSIAVGSIILVRRAASSNTNIWLAVTISAALSGRFVEQLFGSPTTGGVLLFWILIGSLAALLIKPSQQAIKVAASTKPSPVRIYSTYAGITIIALASIVLAWDKGASYLIANQMASFQYRPTTVSADEAIERLEQATRLAPDAPRYWNDLAKLEHGRAASTQNQQTRIEALSQAYEYDLKAFEANPLEVNSVYALAFSAWEAGNTGRPELRQEAVRLYEYLTEIIPSDTLAQERLQILKDFLAQ